MVNALVDVRKPKMDHRVYKKLLSGDGSKKAVVERAIADLQFGGDDIVPHPVLSGSV